MVEEGISIKVFFAVNTGGDNYDFYIGGDRAVPSLFLNHAQILANTTSVFPDGFLNNTGLSVAAYRAHAAVLEQSTLAAENAGCCNGEYLNNYTGETTPFGDPPGWVARVTVSNPEDRYIVAYSYQSYQSGGSNFVGYQPLPDGGFATNYGSAYDSGLRITGACFCDGNAANNYTMRIDVTVESKNVQTWYPEGWAGEPNIDTSTSATAVYGITRIPHPAGSGFVPGDRVVLQRISFTGDSDATVNPDILIFAYETSDPAAINAYFASLNSTNDSNVTLEGVIIAPTGSSCADIGLTSVYADGPSPGFPDACTSSSNTVINDFTGWTKISEARMRDFFAGTTCGNQWMGQTITTPCQPILEDTYEYCVQLESFPKDPDVIPVRKEQPPEQNSVFDGWVGIEGTAEFDMEMPRPGYNGPVIVQDVFFSYCSADPSAYRFLYKWSNPDDDLVNPGERGQDQLTGEGEPLDSASFTIADQNWLDWRVTFQGNESQQGRVNNTPVFNSNAPAPLVLPSIQVTDAQWIASNPDRTKAIATVNGSWFLYTGAASQSLFVAPDATALLTANPRGINWTSTDVLYVTEWNPDAELQPTDLTVHKLTLLTNSLTKISEFQVQSQAIGFTGIDLLSVSAIEI